MRIAHAACFLRSSTPRLDPRDDPRERAPDPEGAAKYPPVAPWRRSGLDGSASRGKLVGLSAAGSGSGASDNDSDSGAQVLARAQMTTHSARPTRWRSHVREADRR